MAPLAGLLCDVARAPCLQRGRHEAAPVPEGARQARPHQPLPVSPPPGSSHGHFLALASVSFRFYMHICLLEGLLKLLLKFLIMALLVFSEPHRLVLFDLRSPVAFLVVNLSKSFSPICPSLRPSGVRRFIVLVRFGVMIVFLRWRCLNPNPDAYPLWLASVICEIWFGLSWLLDQVPKWSPIDRETYLNRLALKYATRTAATLSSS
jgi:hypothetical protein